MAGGIGGGINPAEIVQSFTRSITTPVLIDPKGNIINTDEIVQAPPRPARLRAHAEVYFAGRDITNALDPHLLSIRITDKQEGTSHLSLLIDDRYARFPLPDDGAQCYVKLGWPDQQSHKVFTGYMSDIISNGSRRGGRTVAVEFESADMFSGIKSSITGTWGEGKDAPGGGGKKVPFSKVAEDIAKKAGIDLKIGGKIGEVERSFWQAGNESPMSYLNRIAKELGGVLRVEGNQASIIDLSGTATAGGQQFPTVNCQVGKNVLAWSIRPRSGRAQWGQTAHGFFDRDKAGWLSKVEQVAGGFGFGKAKSQIMGMFPVNEEAMAKSGAKSDAATSVRERGTGWVVIDGEPTAMALGQASINGARPGVDGGYRIVEVEHTYFRGGGYVSRLDVNNPTILSSDKVTGEWKQPG